MTFRHPRRNSLFESSLLTSIHATEGHLKSIFMTFGQVFKTSFTVADKHLFSGPSRGKIGQYSCVEEICCKNPKMSNTDYVIS